MIKYALRKWDAGKDTLCRIIRQTEEREISLELYRHC